MRTPLAIVIVLAGLPAIQACQKVAGQVEQPPRPVKVQTVDAAPAQPSLRYSATIEADRVVSLAFKASGFVDAILQRRGADGRMRPLQAGDTVEAGTVLARVREADYGDRMTQAQSAVREVEASHAKARLDLERARSLFGSDSLTKPELDGAQASFDAAEAQLASAAGQVALAATALHDTAIVAPIGGVILERQIEIGALVSPGVVGFVIARVAPVKAVIGVPDLHVARLALGRSLKVTSDALPGISLDGVVTAIAPSANDQNRLFTVEVSLANRDGALRPGMVGTVDVPNPLRTADPGPASAAIPLAAVVRSATGSNAYGVFVVQGDGDRRVAHARDVQLGDVRGNAVVVTRGLQTGETVVVSGPGLLVDGERIRIIP